MPLLPLEPFVYPADLLCGPAPQDAADPRWWVLHTRPRAEKSLARKFLGRSVAYFLPLQRRQRRKSGRAFVSFVPLFPGYVFLHGDTQARLAALQTNLVARCLEVDDQPRLHADLGRVHRLILSDLPLTAEERLLPGSPVEITDGPFAGMAGKVLRRGKKLKLFIEVQLLQRGVSVEIESWMIQSAQRPPG